MTSPASADEAAHKNNDVAIVNAVVLTGKNYMRYFLIVFSILFLAPGMCAYAAGSPAKAQPPEVVVKALYRDFGREITNRNNGKAYLVDQPTGVLTRYFTPGLAGLIAEERKYVKRTKESGRMDFVLLCGSQDPDGIRNIRINRMPGKNVVAVIYNQNGEKDVMRIEYHIGQTGSGWRITDVRYKARKSIAFPEPGPELSLMKLLSQPL